MPCDFFRVGVRAGDTQKSLRPSESATASFSPHEEVERRRALWAPRKVEPQA
jgi:hypothetical protein